MTFHNDAETDSLYIDLSDKPSVESREVRPGIILDFDDAGQVCGIDADHASRNLGGLETYLLSESALAKEWLRPEEDEVTRQAEAQGVTLSEQIDRLVAEAIRQPPPVIPLSDEAQMEKNRAAIEMLNQWDIEDETNDPEEIARRQAEW